MSKNLLSGTLLELVKDCSENKQNYKIKNGKYLQYLKMLGFKTLAGEYEKKIDLKSRLKKINELGYIRITDNKIIKFLKMKVENYNRVHKRNSTASRTMFLVRDMEMQRNSHMRDFPWALNETPLASRLQQQQAQRARGVEFLSVFAIPATYITPSQVGMDTFREKTCDANSNDEGTIGVFEWGEEKIEDYKKAPPDNILKKLETEQRKGLFQRFTIASVNEIKDPLLLGRLDNCKDRFFIAQWGEDIALDDII